MDDHKMRIVTLIRDPSTDEGTFGVLTTDDDFTCVTGELPWKNNIPNLSCVPEGEYMAKWLYSPSHGTELYHLIDVPGRKVIEIHAGNWCGDTEKGYKSDVLGCIILGREKAELTPEGMNPQMAITASVQTLALFESHMNQEDFLLQIR